MIALVYFLSLYPIQDFTIKTCEIHCIDLNEFEKRFNQHISFTPSSDTLSIETAIDMVRICNTIAYSKTLNTNEKYFNFISYFYSECLALVINKLEALPSRGLSYYSAKHNIYIGGSIHMNSKYCIIDL